MEKPFGVVYLIWNKVNGKKYVGQTIKTVEERFKEHARYKKSDIGKAIRKYGKENFYCGVIVSCSSKEEMDEKEKHYIVALHSKSPFGYNHTDGGDGIVGCTDETRASRSAKLKGVPKSPEHCAAISAGHKGKFIGEKNHRFGKHHTKTVCYTISIKQRGDSPFKNLLSEIDAHNLTYAKLAKLMGFKSMPNISDKMHGRKRFTERDKIKLKEIFGKPAFYLLQHENGTEIAEQVGRKKLHPEHYRNISVKTRNDSQFKNLISEIDANNLTYAALAKLMSLSKSTVSGKMRGDRNFTERDKIKLAEIFGKPVEYLFQRTEQ